MQPTSFAGADVLCPDSGRWSRGYIGDRVIARSLTRNFPESDNDCTTEDVEGFHVPMAENGDWGFANMALHMHKENWRG